MFWPMCKCEVQIIKNIWIDVAYLCWRKLSGRLKCLPHTSHEKAISGLLCVRSWIIRLYDFVNRRWQYLHTYSHFGRILRRKSSLSIFNTVNILKLKGSNYFSFFVVYFIFVASQSRPASVNIVWVRGFFQFSLLNFLLRSSFRRMRANCIYFVYICGHDEFN